MKNKDSISHRLSRKMTLQAIFIGLVAILGIGTASVVIEQFLLREALNLEADHFWENYQKNPDFPLPNTGNLHAYMSESASEASIPEALRGFSAGYHKMDGQTAHSLMYITENHGKRLHLLLDGSSVFRLALFFGIFPLTIVLVIIYITAWWVYRQSNQLLSPIIWLANKFERFDPAHPDSSLKDLSNIPGDVDWEVAKLVESLSSYSRRIKRHVDREHTFTRDASHEFRTPLTVIKMAADMILSEPNLPEYPKKYAMRIRDSVQDLQELVDAFLLLARETDNEFVDEKVDVLDIIESELESASIYLQDKPVETDIVVEYPLVLQTSPKIVSIVLGNLIRNAAIYTDEGNITVTVRADSVEIADTGIGMSEEQVKRIFHPYYRAENKDDNQRAGYGIGLTIVHRLCDRFDWTVSMQSEENHGTRFTIQFIH